MKRLIKYAVLAFVVAVVTHLATVLAAPYVLMDVAMARVSKADGINHWTHPPRTTETSRKVVRPSPDLAYSACVYDLDGGPVHVTASAWDDYMSVSVFAHNSDNIFVINDRQAPQGVDMIIVRKGEPHPPGAALVVESPSRRGIVLQRRVAPTQERWEAANAARRHDICEQLKS
ncbi:DUF1254 domain-containing protein [Solimonas variicoloris]|uniref:DUF1254 domain-containing protein n=1 Tax=Solimonas variicoloris TaxID=254408 RepID=UPI000370AAAF|nr:DUF1254 domain-containing protein [Solimonas variicoloris]